MRSSKQLSNRDGAEEMARSTGHAAAAERRSVLDRVDGGIRILENAVGLALLALIVVDVTLQVIFRYVFENSLSWSSELATYMFAWLTLMGLAIAQRDHAHIEVKFFTNASGGLASALRWIGWGSSLVFFLVLGVGGYLFFEGDTIQSGPATGLPLWTVYSCLPIGAVLGLYHTLHDLPRVMHPDRFKDRPGHGAHG
jgi:TRAP-type C4-dicarboxylate transport system permease small subunit